MLRFLSGAELPFYPKLRSTMFRDRAAQFVGRLGWDVGVTDAGEERDQYDVLNPLYVIWEERDGSHGGSMRFLPMTGRTMLYEHFPDLAAGRDLRSPGIWECTRFCLSPGAGPRVAAALMLGGLELGLGQGLSHALGVFDAPMIRVYRRLGWAPELLGTRGRGREGISAGLWAFAPERRAVLLPRAGLSAEISRHWHRRAMERPEPLRLAG
ncbi:acyl-homoserine-lactone synthase [Ovoidimarina sediminis]|uniref:acyl-homoserine-lactone synthase n=1 Tax=Ovoidimarina sediminis TaxID=3079856 RepID=UPI002910C4B1|nr:acyl-homoserine-lactone synthase [Rhodophyticola sp. MJ-SS7]MDU8944580.1 acyl-homoserine-lactone synthase [Rhodophyticola sp. MJ-SS7]